MIQRFSLQTIETNDQKPFINTGAELQDKTRTRTQTKIMTGVLSDLEKYNETDTEPQLLLPFR